ncbi:MAG TPA: biotin/lipoyl-binding protein, partial [Desulfuromonadaceae bacterium]
MADEDLRGLKIDKMAGSYRPARRRRFIRWLAAASVVLIAGLAGKVLLSQRVEVETTTVSLVYPSQTIALLNASGYVVAQRKSAVAAKTTGRLVWLGVEEGSRVRAGEIIARLENEDVTATRAQAAANLVNSRATLAQAEAELKDATLAFNRNRDLLAAGVVAQADLDASEARYRKARAGVDGAAAAIKAARAALSGADVAIEYTLIRA